MNKHDASHKRFWSVGQSAVEFGIAVPILALLLVAASDFARVFFFSIAVNNAARAGAQYGAQSVISARDTSGMQTAATNDASNVPGITAVASSCTCTTSTTVTNCGTSYNCADYPKATFVEVDTSATFNTIVNYPGLANSFSLTGKAILPVRP